MKRVKAIDVAKGIGIIFIVLGHAVPDAFLRTLLYAFHVPLFFILSGFTYTQKMDKKSFFLTKVKRLLVPYFVFAIISILIFFIMTRVISLRGDSRIIPNMIGMLYANSNSGYMLWNRPLWFLPCLFITTLMVDTYESMLLKLRKQEQSIYRWIFIVIFWWIGISVNVQIKNLFLPFHLESALFLAAFFEVGIILANWEAETGVFSKIRENRKHSWMLLCVLVCAGIVTCCINGGTDIRIHRFGKYPVCLILSSLLLSFATLLLAVKFENMKWLQSVGISSLPIMLMHKFPILFFQEVVPGAKTLLNETDTVPGFFCGVIVTVITVIMCIVAEKIIIVLFPWMLGKSKKKAVKTIN